MCFYFPADSHILLYDNLILQQDYLLSCAYISLLQAIRCYMIILYCSKVNYFLSCAYISLLIAIRCYMISSTAARLSFILCLYFFAASHTLLYEYLILQQDYLLSCAYLVLMFSC